MNNHYLKPEWPAPPHVHAFVTTRVGGKSLSPYDSFNLAYHVNDNPHHVGQNREQLMRDLNLPNQPYWINQIHSTTVVEAHTVTENTSADAMYSLYPNHVCAILTADCLPILITNTTGTVIAAIHAGWRGLAQGIIANTLQTLPSSVTELIAWLGPAISSPHYEVGREVRDQFVHQHRDAEQAFTLTSQDRWHACLYTLAKQQLQQLGVHQIYGGNLCTYANPELFFSYRRDIITGRMATLIWFSPHTS